MDPGEHEITLSDATATYASAISEAPAQMVRTSSVVTGQPARVRLIALKSENVYAVTTYRINGGSLSYVLASGGAGSVDLTGKGWRGASPPEGGTSFCKPKKTRPPPTTA